MVEVQVDNDSVACDSSVRPLLSGRDRRPRLSPPLTRPSPCDLRLHASPRPLASSLAPTHASPLAR